MARRYDSRTTIFSPEGRLYQVEYAMEAISHSGAAVGLLAGENAAVLAAEKRITSKLLDATRSSERLYQVDDHVGVAVAGITADANILINALRLSAQRYTFRYQEPMPIEQLVQDICDHKQGYTQFGGLRPFGVSFLFAGWDKHFGMQLYNSNPSGNYSGWKATAIGANHQSAQSILKSDYKDDMSVDDAVKLALKVLNKTMDSTALTPEKVELVTMKVKDGKLSYHVYKKEELEPLLNASNESAAQDANE